MAISKPKNINEYIAGFPENTQGILEQIRSVIHQTVPEAGETISYGIPTFTLEGRYLIYFAGYKNHVSLYPAPRNEEAFRDELAVYKGGKGTVQFPLAQPIPLDLIVRMVLFQVKNNKTKNRKIKK